MHSPFDILEKRPEGSFCRFDGGDIPSIAGQVLLFQIPNRFATAWIRTELFREYLAQDLLDLGCGCFLVRMAVLHC